MYWSALKLDYGHDTTLFWRISNPLKNLTDLKKKIHSPLFAVHAGVHNHTWFPYIAILGSTN